MSEKKDNIFHSLGCPLLPDICAILTSFFSDEEVCVIKMFYGQEELPTDDNRWQEIASGCIFWLDALLWVRINGGCINYEVLMIVAIECGGIVALPHLKRWTGKTGPNNFDRLRCAAYSADIAALRVVRSWYPYYTFEVLADAALWNRTNNVREMLSDPEGIKRMKFAYLSVNSSLKLTKILTVDLNSYLTVFAAAIVGLGNGDDFEILDLIRPLIPQNVSHIKLRLTRTICEAAVVSGKEELIDYVLRYLGAHKVECILGYAAAYGNTRLMAAARDRGAKAFDKALAAAGIGGSVEGARAAIAMGATNVEEARQRARTCGHLAFDQAFAENK
jgi:hypothetical protein